MSAWFSCVRLLLPVLAVTSVLGGCGRDLVGLPDKVEPTLDLRFVPRGPIDLYRNQVINLDVQYRTDGVWNSVLGEEGLSLIQGETGTEPLLLGAGGAFTANEPGQLIARAVYRGLVARLEINVRDATLESLRLEPNPLALRVNQATQLRTTAVLSDASEIDVTPVNAGTTYQVPSNAASVDVGGRITGLVVGEAYELIATHGGLSTSVTFSVSGEEDRPVALQLLSPTDMVVGQTVSPNILVSYSSGRSESLPLNSPGLVLSTETPNQLEVLGDNRVVALSPGIGRLRAEYMGLAGEISVAIMENLEIVELLVDPFLLLEVGQSFQLIVQGRQTDGSIVDLTGSPALSYRRIAGSQPAAVALSPSGVVLGENEGFARVEISGFGRVARVEVEVFGESELVGLEVQPFSPIALNVGESIQLTVLAFYSNGAVRDVTFDPQTNYLTFPDSAVAVVGPGLVQGLFQGFGEVQVDFQGLADFAFFDVGQTGGTIIDLFVQPDPIIVEVAGSANFRVFGLRSDGSQVDLTFDPGLFIFSDDGVLADVFGPGEIRGFAAGTTFLNVSYQAIARRVDVRIVPPGMEVLVGITLTTNPVMQVSDREPYSVTAFYSSGRLVDITFDPGLSVISRNPNVVSVQADLLVGLSEGRAEIVATYQAQSSVALVDVIRNMDPIVALFWVPGSLTLQANGRPGSSQLRARRASGVVENVSGDPLLILTTSGPVIANQLGGRIEVLGTANGQGAVNASLDGLQATLPVTVSGNVTVVSIQILAPAQMLVNTSDMFAVLALMSDGSVQDVSGSAALMLNISPPSRLSIVGGQITANTVGSATVRATFGGQQATATVRVVNQMNQLARIEFVPSSMNLQVNGPGEVFQLFAVFTDGTRLDITFDPQVIYTGFGPIQGNIQGNGIEVFATGLGMAGVDATYQGQSDSLTITITNGMAMVTRLFLNAPAFVDIGTMPTYTVTAEFSDGSIRDVTNDPGLTVAVDDPMIFTAANGFINPLTVGSARLGVSFGGFSAVRLIQVVNNNPITSIFFQPTQLSLQQGGIGQFELIGRRNTGDTDVITADPNVTYTPSPNIILGPPGASPQDVILLGTNGGSVIATFMGLTATLPVSSIMPVQPVITMLSPDQLGLDDGLTQIQVIGTGFSANDTVVVAGQPVQTTFVSSTELIIRVRPRDFLNQPGQISVRTFGPNGPSNVVQLEVGEAPIILSYAPNRLFVGSTVTVNAIGSGLSNLTITSGNLNVTLLQSAPDGSSIRFTVTAPANLMPGSENVTFTNPFGQAVVSFTVLVPSMTDLIVPAGNTVTLSGTNTYRNIVVETGGQLVGQGNEALILLASGNITVRGSISVDGSAGVDGLTNPAAGGNAGPGGAGGGGGGDGNAGTPALGGQGAPPGEAAGAAAGLGTPGGHGGGFGGGLRGENQCGAGGGGGALGGNGGAGGGDLGPGTGGAGGVASSGSNFGGGTGGGGATTCGTNSGGGGGGGGGVLVLEVATGGTILIDGRISADGGAGGEGFSGTGGAGGGSGGLIELLAPGGTITVNDTVSVSGGDGGGTDFGDAGGGGGGGVVLLDATPGGSVNAAIGILDISGGAAGISRGGGSSARPGQPGLSNIAP